MAWTQDQKRLARAALAALYPDGARARGLLEDAGVDPGTLPFGGRALELWAAPIEELARRGALGGVILRAWEEHPDDPALQALRAVAAPALLVTRPAPLYASAASGALSARPRVESLRVAPPAPSRPPKGS